MYKRQAVFDFKDLTGVFFLVIDDHVKLASLKLKFEHTVIPVSYTHLDVYKRQEYSVPYTWGVLGLIYNTKMVEDEAVVASWGACGAKPIWIIS